MKKIISMLIVVLLCCSIGICSCAQVVRKSFLKSLLEGGEVLERVYSEEFKDVKHTDDFSDYVQAALEAGIIAKSEFFRPYDSITRDEAVQMVKSILVYLKRDFKDAEFASFKGTELLSEADRDALIGKMCDIYLNGKIKTGNAKLDEKINYILHGEKEVNEVAAEYFNSGFKKVIGNASVKDYERGCEEISMAYGAMRSERDSILTGEYVFDDNGGIVQGHGGNVFFDEKTQKYYMYGEARKTSNPPENLRKYADWGWRIGVACYSSEDLYNWKYESLALEMKENYWGMKFPESDIRVGEVLERPKVIYNKKTDKYVMWMHIDTGNYGYARAGVAVSDYPTGPFEYVTSYRPRDKMSRDMTVFQDNDGSAYIYFSTDENASLACSRLSDDYLEPVGDVYYCIERKWREAPAVFRYKDTYYMITSGCTGWDPNEADYATAPAPTGPWTQHGNPCVGENAHITFGGQSHWVMPLDSEKGHFIFMADIWRPEHHSESGSIWLPIQIQPDGQIRIEWLDEWKLEDVGSTVVKPDSIKAVYGEDVKLPEKVKLIGQTATEERHVKWNIPPMNYPGHYVVTGEVENSKMQAEADVYCIPESLTYFIDCGSEKSKDFDIIAQNTFNSSSDQQYGIDEKTKKRWGYAADTESGHLDNEKMENSVRYDYSDGGEKNVGKGITYRMEAEEGKTYSVFVAVKDPWGEKGRYIDLLVNGKNVVDGYNTEGGYRVFLVKNIMAEKGEISVSSVRDERSVESHLDPILSWIMVCEGDVKAVENADEPQEEAEVFLAEYEPLPRILTIKGTVLALTYDKAGGLRAEQYKGTQNQKWMLEYNMEGSCLINTNAEDVQAVRTLDVSSASKESGAWVIDYKKTYGDNQKWFFEKQPDGSYLIRSVNSDLYLTYEDGHFCQREKGAAYQKWVVKASKK